jgi:hypothetical protein
MNGKLGIRLYKSKEAPPLTLFFNQTKVATDSVKQRNFS